jgi:phosphatidylserine/phosphatidylglycerophosphate/cardiolipin synthase-like enzyme
VLFFPSVKNTDRYFEIIRSANKYIKFCFYALSFERIAKQLRILTKEKDIKTYIILDPCMLRRYPTNNCVNQLNTLKNVKIRFFPADELRRMHHKYVTIDGRLVITGSLNLTY